jgi:arylsulfatase A-like enzyme
MLNSIMDRRGCRVRKTHGGKAGRAFHKAVCVTALIAPAACNRPDAARSVDSDKHNLYDGEIAYTDQQLGRFLDAVAKKAPAANTLVVVLANHGESLGEHGEFNHGIFLYDATLHIPFLIAGPGVPAGVRVQQQARTIDVLPTVLELMGGKAPATVQGASLMPAFAGKSVQTAYSYEETLYPKMNMGWSELRGIRTARWKYVRAPRPELYDLVQDPSGKMSGDIPRAKACFQAFVAKAPRAQYGKLIPQVQAEIAAMR